MTASVPFRALIIADSLAGHRPDGIDHASRWPQLLQKELGGSWNITNRAKGASTTRQLRSVPSDRHFDLIIVQLGIVDCVPRLLGQWEQRLLARLPAMARKATLRHLKAYRARDQKRAYVQEEEFSENIQKFLDRMPCKVAIIKILEPTVKFTSQNAGAGASVQRYNSRIVDAAQKHSNAVVVQVDTNLVDELTLDDGYHLNRAGHQYVASMLIGAGIFRAASSSTTG